MVDSEVHVGRFSKAFEGKPKCTESPESLFETINSPPHSLSITLFY